MTVLDDSTTKITVLDDEIMNSFFVRQERLSTIPIAEAALGRRTEDAGRLQDVSGRLVVSSRTFVSFLGDVSCLHDFNATGSTT